MLLSVVVVTPSRGLVHTRTVAAVNAALQRAEESQLVRAVQGEWWKFAHGLPIPQAHEDVTEQAMATGADLVWFIEDDNVPPVEALAASVRTMQATGAGVVPVTYPVGIRGTRWNSVYSENGEVLFCGLGITLIDRRVLESVARPWFSLDRHYGRVPDGEGGTKLGLLDRPFPKNVGGVDVAFHLRVREAGWKIVPVPKMVGGHIRIKKRGADSGSGVNDQPHDVVVWDTIDADQTPFVGRDSDRFQMWDRQWPMKFKALQPWVTGFWIADHWMGGKYDAVHDKRLNMCRTAFPDVSRVLELGSLEGGHTVALARLYDEVVGVEGRASNAYKARWILEIHRITNARIQEANLETFDLSELGSFDLVFSVGVLYHLPEPLKLIAQCADRAPALFLWTHYSPRGNDPHTYGEHGLQDPLSGLSPTSTWLPKDQLLAELRDRYEHVEVLADELIPAGPCITVAAWQ